MAERKVLNIDELFSKTKPIVVIFGGREYDFSRPIDLSPSQLTKFERLSKKMTSLGQLEKEPGDYTDEDAEFVEEILDDLILTICEDFPVKTLPFMAKVYIITNYQNEIEGSDGGVMDELPKAPKTEGETSTGD
jgi:hypothetical protein